jgi:hypothetical protein
MCKQQVAEAVVDLMVHQDKVVLVVEDVGHFPTLVPVHKAIPADKE